MDATPRIGGVAGVAGVAGGSPLDVIRIRFYLFEPVDNSMHTPKLFKRLVCVTTPSFVRHRGWYSESRVGIRVSGCSSLVTHTRGQQTRSGGFCLRRSETRFPAPRELTALPELLRLPRPHERTALDGSPPCISVFSVLVTTAVLALLNE